MKRTLLFFLSLMVIYLSAQIPGGVANPAFWIYGASENGVTTWENPDQEFQDTYPNTQVQYVLNGNPAKYINNQSYNFTLQGLEKDQMSVFCVYQVEDTLQENHVWSLSQNTKLSYELSSFRFADLEDYRYKNLRVYSQKYPELHSYLHFKDSLYASPFQLQLGAKSSYESLPIEGFKGIMPEVIIYSRSLSSRDKEKVESYLAVKYGINLSQTQPNNYINSAGDIWWKASDNGAYHYNVFAVAKDDASGLFQKESRSAYAQELLSISYSNPEAIQDKEAIFVSDNGRSLELNDEENGSPTRIGRKWRISSQNFRELDLKLNLEEIQNRKEGEYLYLEIDMDGNPDTSSFPNQYQRISETETVLVLNNYLFDADQSGADKFSIIQAPEMFVQLELEFPECGDANEGNIKSKIEGGEAPYQLSIQDSNGNIVANWSQNDNTDIHYTEELPLGDYTITVKDAEGNSYEQSFYIQSKNTPGLALLDHYNLIEGSNLRLDASANMPAGIRYQWYEDGRFLSNHPEIKITSEGTYQVKIQTQEGCQFRKNIKVESQSADNIRSFDIFPNPSKGDYMVRIILERAAETQLEVYDLSGRKLQAENLGTDNYFLFRGNIANNGIYLIQVISENSKKTKKLIIKQ